MKLLLRALKADAPPVFGHDFRAAHALDYPLTAFGFSFLEYLVRTSTKLVNPVKRLLTLGCVQVSVGSFVQVPDDSGIRALPNDLNAAATSPRHAPQRNDESHTGS